MARGPAKILTPGDSEQGRPPMVFAFPLTDKAADCDEDSLFKVLEAEYAAKYLEQLGANPSQAAQEIVRKALPLTADCLQVKLKAAGHNASEVLVTPPAYQAEILPIQEADPQDVVRLGFVGTLGEAADDTADSLQEMLWEQPVVSRSFRQVAAKFLGRPTDMQNCNQSQAGNASLNASKHSTGRAGLGHQTSLAQPRAGRVGVFCNMDHMQKELSRPFNVLPAAVKRIQLHFGQSVTEWYDALPKAAKGGHGQLKEQDIQRTADELVSDEVVSLAVDVATFLYHEFVVSSPAFPLDQLASALSCQPLVSQRSGRQQHALTSQRSSFVSNWDAFSASSNLSKGGSFGSPAQSDSDPASLAATVTLLAAAQKARLFSIVQLWAQRSRFYNQSKWGTTFARPVVILSLRALVDKVFNDVFPLWILSAHGTARLQSMDAQLLEWFDPHSFNSSISLLQSLPPAAQASKGQKHGQPAKYVIKHKRQHFTGTTSLVGAFLSEPKTAACRRLQQRKSTAQHDSMRMASELDQQQKGVMMRTAENLLFRPQ